MARPSLKGLEGTLPCPLKLLRFRESADRMETSDLPFRRACVLAPPR